jgi:hypothetical protein
VTAGTPVEELAGVAEPVAPQAAVGDAVAELAGAGFVAAAAPDEPAAEIGGVAEVGQACSPVAPGGFEAGQVCFRVVPAESVVGQDELRVVQVLLQAGRAGLVVSGGGCWVVLAVSPVDLGG